MLFSWLNPLLKAGASKNKLGLEDIYALPPAFASQHILENFNASWAARSSSGRRPVWQLIFSMWDMFSSVYLGAMLLKIGSDMFKFVGPISLQVSQHTCPHTFPHTCPAHVSCTGASLY